MMASGNLHQHCKGEIVISDEWQCDIVPFRLSVLFTDLFIVLLPVIKRF